MSIIYLSLVQLNKASFPLDMDVDKEILAKCQSCLLFSREFHCVAFLVSYSACSYMAHVQTVDTSLLPGSISLLCILGMRLESYSYNKITYYVDYGGDQKQLT